MYILFLTLYFLTSVCIYFLCDDTFPIPHVFYKISCIFCFSYAYLFSVCSGFYFLMFILYFFICLLLSFFSANSFLHFVSFFLYKCLHTTEISCLFYISYAYSFPSCSALYFLMFTSILYMFLLFLYALITIINTLSLLP